MCNFVKIDQIYYVILIFRHFYFQFSVNWERGVHFYWLSDSNQPSCQTPVYYFAYLFIFVFVFLLQKYVSCINKIGSQSIWTQSLNVFFFSFSLFLFQCIFYLLLLHSYWLAFIRSTFHIYHIQIQNQNVFHFISFVCRFVDNWNGFQ